MRWIELKQEDGMVRPSDKDEVWEQLKQSLHLKVQCHPSESAPATSASANLDAGNGSAAPSVSDRESGRPDEGMAMQGLMMLSHR